MGRKAVVGQNAGAWCWQHKYASSTRALLAVKNESVPTLAKTTGLDQKTCERKIRHRQQGGKEDLEGGEEEDEV